MFKQLTFLSLSLVWKQIILMYIDLQHIDDFNPSIIMQTQLRWCL